MKAGHWGGSSAAVLPVLASLLLLGGCDEPASPAGGQGAAQGGSAEGGAMEVERQEVPGSENGAVVTAGKTDPEPVMWSPERAGYARHLSADTSWYLEARQLEMMWGWLEQFQDEEVAQKVAEALDDPAKLKAMAEEAGVEGMEDVDEEAMEKLKEVGDAYGAEGMELARKMFGEEIFVSARGLGWWAQAFEGYQAKSNRRGVALVVEAMANGEFSLFGENEEMEGLMEDTVDDLMKLYEEVERRPVLGFQMGGKVSEGRAEVLASLRGWMEKGAGEWDAASPHSFEKGGVTWTGMTVDLSKIDGGSVVDAEDAEDADEALGESDDALEDGEGGAELSEERMAAQEKMEELRDALMEVPMVLACAEVGDYVVVYAGYGEHSLGVAERTGDSLAANADWSYLREYPADALLGMVWLEKDVVGSAYRQGSWEPMWGGVADGLSNSEGLDMGLQMAASAQKLAALSKERAKGTAHASVGALVVDEGLRWEARGGWHGEGLDLDSALELAGAMRGRDDSMLMRAHWKVTDAYREQGVRGFEEIVNLVRLIGEEMQIGAAEEVVPDDEEPGEDAERERQMAELFQKEFVKGMEELWTGYRDYFIKGVGSESALVVDLAGELPPVPGLEEDVLENGKIPRVAYLRPVRSRDDLRQTWDLWRGSGVRMLGVLSEAVEQPIPFPDTMSADKGDLRTYFFSMPFVTEDFLPSVSVSDELFVMGTSKQFSEELYAAVVKHPSGGEVETGVVMEINGSALWDFCETWHEVSLRKAALMEEMNGEDAGAVPADDLRGLLEEAGEAAGDAAEPEAADVEDGAVGPDDLVPAEDLDEFGVSEDADGGEESPSAFESLTGGTSWEDAVRTAIAQARWFRGASYRKWLDDGVPRSSTRIHWGDPAELAE